MGDTGIGRHGAFTRTAAIEVLGPYEVRRRLEVGGWSSPWTGVLVERERADDPLTLASAALLLGGPDVLIAGPTAAHLHGCTAVPPTPIHLAVPYGHWLRSRPGLRVHNDTLLEPDRDSVLDLAVLGLERVVTDMLCTARPSDALAVTDQALAKIEMSQRDQFRGRVAGRLEHRRDPRGARRGAALLGLATGFAESPAESWLLWMIADAGYPLPEVNWSLRGPDVLELYRLDLAWPAQRIAVEYYGYAVHVHRTAEDEARADDLRRRGWIVVIVWVDDLRNPGPFEQRLDDAFRLRGMDMSRRCAGGYRGRRHREAREVRIGT